jgi:hypothetical protein
MLAHYSHVRIEAKRHALDALSSRRAVPPEAASKERAYGTKRVTKPDGVAGDASEVVVSDPTHR